MSDNARPQFIPGLELSRRFYAEVVRPTLDARFPGLPHAAARIGAGSEVLGFDTEMSTDHDWGPAVTLFLADAAAQLARPIEELLSRELPETFLGFPVQADAPEGTQRAGLPPRPHRVHAVTLREYVREHIDHHLDAPLDAADWLTISSQKLRELTAGAVHHDGVGALTELRARLAYYPRDVWLYLLACGWERIGQEEHLMPRAGYVGDELGSAVIAARLVRDVMGLCFLMERQYAPYPKWFGTAFRQLRCAAELEPPLWAALRAERWQERASALAGAYERLARMHNDLGLTPAVPAAAVPFFSRPFPVIYGGGVAQALREQIADPQVQRIAARRPIGGIDQWSDSTDMRAHAQWRRTLRALYTG